MCSLPVTEPRGLDKSMSCDIVLGTVDPGASRVSFEDFESGKHNSTRRRGDDRENAIAAVDDIHRRSGNHIVVLKVLQCQGVLTASQVDRLSGGMFPTGTFPSIVANCATVGILPLGLFSLSFLRNVLTYYLPEDTRETGLRGR